MDFINDVLSGKVSLPTVSRVVGRVLTQLRKGETSLADLAHELRQDPVLSSRVLRLANSSFFSGRRSLSSIEDAVGVIGFQPLQTLVVASGAMAAFTQVPAVNLRQFWLASVVTAAAARRLADVAGEDREAAYSAGLLQGIGHLILCQCHAQQALDGFSSLQTLWGPALAAKELAIFGVAHPLVSAAWIEQLSLPAEVAESVRQVLSPASEEAPRLARVLQAAVSLASSSAAGESALQAAVKLNAPAMVALGLSDHLASNRFISDYDALAELQVPQ